MAEINYSEITTTDALNSGKDKINKLLKNVNNGVERFKRDWIADDTFDISTLYKEGNYIIAAANSGNPTGGLAILIVFNSKTTERHATLRVIQKIIGLSSGTEYGRVINYNNSTSAVVSITPWQAPSQAGKFTYAALTSSDDLNDITNDTNLISINALNQPTSGVYSVKVETFYTSKSAGAQYWGTQTATQSYPKYTSATYTRNFNTNAGVTTFSNWVKLDDGARFSNIEIAYMGDSTVEHGNMPDIVSERLGVKVHDISYGGTRMAKHEDVDYGALSGSILIDNIVSNNYATVDTAVANLIAKGDNNTTNTNILKAINWSKVGYIISQFGANDYAGNVPLGTINDTTTDTFYGSLDYYVKTILTNYPSIKIVFIAQHYRKNSDGSDTLITPNTNGTYYHEYIKAIKDVTEKYGLPCLDLYKTSGINSINFATYIADTVHPTSLGYELLGNKVASFIQANF